MHHLVQIAAACSLAAGLLLGARVGAAASQLAKAKDPLPEGALVRFSAPKGETIQPLGFSTDGKTAFLWTKAPNFTGKLLLGNLDSGKTTVLRTGNWFKTALAPDAKSVITNGPEFEGSSNDVFAAWSIPDGAKVASFAKVPGYANEGFVISPDGEKIAWADRKIFVYFSNTAGKPLIREAKGTRYVTDVAFSPDGKALAILYGAPGGHKDYQIQLWDTANWQQTALLIEERKYGANDLSFSPDGKRLGVGVGSGIVVWDLASKKISHQITHGGNHAKWLPDGHALAMRSSAPKKINVVYVSLVEDSTGELVAELKGHKQHVMHYSLDARGLLLASGDKEHVIVWDLQALPGFEVKRKVKLPSKEIMALWHDLDAKPPAKGYRALLQLAQGGDGVVAFLRAHLKAAPAKDAKGINDLINALGSDSFEEREKATATLKGMGRMVEDDMQAALKIKVPFEAEQRLKKLLQHLDETKLLPGELQGLRAVVVLERIGTKAAKEVLKVQASGGSWSVQTRAAQSAIDRLVKCEKQEVPKQFRLDAK